MNEGIKSLENIESYFILQGDCKTAYTVRDVLDVGLEILASIASQKELKTTDMLMIGNYLNSVIVIQKESSFIMTLQKGITND
ncbi:MAG: hypothetical protein WC810_14410 [Janthinobacterium sp.]